MYINNSCKGTPNYNLNTDRHHCQEISSSTSQLLNNLMSTSLHRQPLKCPSAPMTNLPTVSDSHLSSPTLHSMSECNTTSFQDAKMTQERCWSTSHANHAAKAGSASGQEKQSMKTATRGNSYDDKDGQQSTLQEEEDLESLNPASPTQECKQSLATSPGDSKAVQSTGATMKKLFDGKKRNTAHTASRRDSVSRQTILSVAKEQLRHSGSKSALLGSVAARYITLEQQQGQTAEERYEQIISLQYQNCINEGIDVKAIFERVLAKHGNCGEAVKAEPSIRTPKSAAKAEAPTVNPSYLGVDMQAAQEQARRSSWIPDSIGASHSNCQEQAGVAICTDSVRSTIMLASFPTAGGSDPVLNPPAMASTLKRTSFPVSAWDSDGNNMPVLEDVDMGSAGEAFNDDIWDDILRVRRSTALDLQPFNRRVSNTHIAHLYQITTKYPEASQGMGLQPHGVLLEAIQTKTVGQEAGLRRSELEKPVSQFLRRFSLHNAAAAADPLPIDDFDDADLQSLIDILDHDSSVSDINRSYSERIQAFQLWDQDASGITAQQPPLTPAAMAANTPSQRCLCTTPPHGSAAKKHRGNEQAPTSQPWGLSLAQRHTVQNDGCLESEEKQPQLSTSLGMAMTWDEPSNMQQPVLLQCLNEMQLPIPQLDSVMPAVVQVSHMNEGDTSSLLPTAVCCEGSSREPTAQGLLCNTSCGVTSLCGKSALGSGKALELEQQMAGRLTRPHSQDMQADDEMCDGPEDCSDDVDNDSATGNGERRVVTKQMLELVYHLPINAAAQSLGMGVTVLKKFCRKFNVGRWPFRKLSSIDKLIDTIKQESLESPDRAATAASLLHELILCREEIYRDPMQEIPGSIKRLRQANFKNVYKHRHTSRCKTGESNEEEEHEAKE